SENKLCVYFSILIMSPHKSFSTIMICYGVLITLSYNYECFVLRITDTTKMYHSQKSARQLMFDCGVSTANLTLISVLGQWDPSFFRGCGKLVQLHLSEPALEQVSANRYVTMVIYQKLLPRTKKRGVFYLSLKI